MSEVKPAKSAAGSYTRWLSIALLPFLAVASVLLYLLPSRSGELFAWPIAPPLSAMLLASAYLGGIWFFIRVIRLNNWSVVRHGFPAVFVFATLAGIATLLHLDKFNAGHISFITWLVLYLTTPFLVIAAIAVNSRSTRVTTDPIGYRMPAALRIVLAAIGLAATATGLAMFIAPEAWIPIWPWTVTPLTARIIGAVLTLPGVVNVSLLWDSRWNAFRSIFQAEMFSLLFIIGALTISSADLLWSRPATPIFVIGIAISAAAYLAFYLFCEARNRREGRLST